MRKVTDAHSVGQHRRAGRRERLAGADCPKRAQHGSRTGAAEGTPCRNGQPSGKAHAACGAAGAAEGTPNSEPDRRKGRSGAARRAREAGRRCARRNGRVPARGVPKAARETASARSALPEGTAEPETGATRNAARQGAQSHEISRGGEAAGAAPPSYHQAKKSLDRVIGSMYWPSLYTRILPEATSSMSMTLPSAS